MSIPLSPLNIPILETPRLLLRPHRRRDFPDSAALWADPIVTRYIGGKPLSREEVWARLLRYVGHWHWLGFGYWALEEKSSGRFVGELGFADNQRELDPPLKADSAATTPMPELAAMAWGDKHFSTPTFCLIHPENAASIRVAQKCGSAGPRRATYKGEPTLVFTGQP